MRWGMVIDLVKCSRCHGCVAACRVEHFLPLRVTWVKLIASETEEGGVVDVSTFPVRCNQCKEAPCVEVCPTEASTQRPDGIVSIDPDKCIGCRYCVVACPYQNRTFLSKDKNPGYFPDFPKTSFEKMGEKLYPHQVGTTMKCNFCMERIDAGLEKGLKPGIDRDATPACVNTCQARALTFGNLDDPDSNVAKLVRERNGFVLQEEYATEPSVYYVDGKIGGKSNIAPEWAMTGSHMTHLSSVEKRAREVLGSAQGKRKEE